MIVYSEAGQQTIHAWFPYFQIKLNPLQGCSHAFDIGGAQASKIILVLTFLSQISGGPNPTFTIVWAKYLGGPGPPGP